MLGLPKASFRTRPYKKRQEDGRKSLPATFASCSNYWVSYSFDSAHYFQIHLKKNQWERRARKQKFNTKFGRWDDTGWEFEWRNTGGVNLFDIKFDQLKLAGDHFIITYPITSYSVEYFIQPLDVEPFLELTPSNLTDLNEFLRTDCEIELKCTKFFAKKIKTHFNTTLFCIVSSFKSNAD